MFAIGITGLDLSSQRYFDITLQNYSVAKNESGTFKSISNVFLSPCNFSQWEGVNGQISESFTTLNFKQWLCPPTDYVFPLQGKFTSSIFKYAKLVVQECGIISNSSTCASSTQVSSFVSSNQGMTMNFYFINPNINAGSEEYLNYYLEDSNYFSFNTATGVNANLYFSEFSIETDHSILPWSDSSSDVGAMVTSSANSQVFSVESGKQYARIYLRKAS
jgi:hypothetical protein